MVRHPFLGLPLPRRAVCIFYLEMATKPLKLLERVLTYLSKCGLKSLDNQADFDSAIRRFESSRPSHAFPEIGDFVMTGAKARIPRPLRPWRSETVGNGLRGAN